MSHNYDSSEEIERRIKFYHSEEARRHLKKFGIPKSKTAMKDLVASMFPDPDQETVESMGHVHFMVHPQQINITDMTNGKLIVSIDR